jgi:aspartate-semialdehyde dehydrogenase
VKRAGVVRPNTLIGRELRAQLAERSDLFDELRLLSADPDEIGQLAEGAGGATFVSPLAEDAFDGLAAVFFCGEIAADRPWIERVPREVVAIVLSSGAGSADGRPRVAGLGGVALDQGPLLSPHPAAIGAALLLARLLPLGVRAAHAVAMMPVSTRGQRALDELFAETRALLAFQAPKRAAGRAQNAFNVQLAESDAGDVARQTLVALGTEIPFSLQIVDAGLFHGVGLALHVELAAAADAKRVRELLAADARIEVARKPAGVSPVALAGSERLVVGEVRAGATADRISIWAAFDNLTRGGALAAVELAEEIVGGSPVA